MTIYGPAAFTESRLSFDLHSGHLFYDRAEAYTQSWDEVMKTPLKSVVILIASKGAVSLVRYRIDEIANGAVVRGIEQDTNQTDFWRKFNVILLPP